MQFKKLIKPKKKEYITLKVQTPTVPKGLVRKCNKCGAALFVEDVKERNYMCPKCGGYMVIKGNKLVCENEACRHVEIAEKTSN